MSNVFWVWTMLTVILVVAEVYTGGWFTAPWAIGAACAAAATALGGGMWWQWSLFVGVSSIVLVVVQRRRQASSRGRSER